MSLNQWKLITLSTVLFVIIFYPEKISGNNQGITKFLERTRSIWARNTKADHSELGLDLHNYLREDHNTPPLQNNAELETAAQDAADIIILSDDFEGITLAPRIRGNLNYSQNVFNISDEWIASRHTFGMLWAIGSWYEEVNSYESNNPSVSSFTRLIWKASTDFGIGIASKGNNTVVVANYAPPSPDIATSDNFELFQQNVLPEKDTDFSKSKFFQPLTSPNQFLARCQKRNDGGFHDSNLKISVNDYKTMFGKIVWRLCVSFY